MFHKPLVTHVTTKLAEGVPIEKITEDLLLEGWTRDDVDEAYKYSMFPEKLKTFSLVRFLDSEVPVFVTVLIFIFIIGIFLASFFLFKEKTYSYTVSVEAPLATTTTFTYGEQPALSDPVFFEKVKNEFISEHANFIEVDLSTMIARAYKSGQIVLEVPVKTIGREGSWWETPAGLYKIASKEPKHFSGMGHVYMPWSMNFQGNFFIHGWPYYPDGTQVATTYSGGCIRMTNDDAKKLYDVAEVGMPILVFKKSFTPDNFSYVNSMPSLPSTAYLAADLRSNFVFMKKESTTVLPIASVTKLMTALVTTEYINLDNMVTVPAAAIVYTSKARLQVGQQISIYQLLFPLLMESSNEAAETIARAYGRDSFIKHMNEKAASLGMTHTIFVDSSGAGEENVSTTEDLFALAKYIYENRSFVFNITSGKIKNSAYGKSIFNNLGNYNSFAGNPLFFGGKVGKTTAAGETELSVFEIPFGIEKRPVVVIDLGSGNTKNDIQSVIDYLSNNFAKKQ